MNVCPNCNSQLEDGVGYCPYCGAVQDYMVTCNSCGAQTSSQNAFCQICGASLTYSEVIASDEKKKGFRPGKKMIIIPVCLVAALAIVFGAVMMFLPGIERLVLGDRYYFLYREAELVNDAICLDSISKLVPPSTFSAKTWITADVEFDDEMGAYVDDLNFEDIINDSAVLLDVSYSSKQSSLFVEAGLTGDDRASELYPDVLDARLLVCPGGIAMDFPGVIDGKAVLSSGGRDSQELFDSLSSLNDTNITSTAISLFKATKDRVERVGDVDKNGDSVRFEFTGEEIDELLIILIEGYSEIAPDVNVVGDLCDYLESSDNYFLSYLGQQLGYMYSNEDLLDSLLYELEEHGAFDFYDEIVIEVVYDWRGNIIAETIEIDGYEIATLDVNKNNGVTYYDIKYTLYDSEEYNISIEKEPKIGSSNLRIDVKFEWRGGSGNIYSDEFIVTFVNAKTQKCGGVGVLTGEMQFTYLDNSEEVIRVNALASKKRSNYRVVLCSDKGFDGFEALTVTLNSELSSKARSTDLTAEGRSTLDIDETTVYEIAAQLVANLSDEYGDGIAEAFGFYW